MKPKTYAFLSLSGLAALALTSTAFSAVVFDTEGVISYSYSAAGDATPLPPASEATVTTNIEIDNVINFPDGSAVVGVVTNDTNPGTITFHFQTGVGLVFSNDVDLAVGTTVFATGAGGPGGSVVADYSYDNSTWTTWGTNNNEALDKGLSATNVADGESDLYVRFTITGAGAQTTHGSAGITWGGGEGERAFELTGTVVPEPSTTALFGLGGLALLRRRRR